VDVIRVKGRSLYISLLERGVEVVRISPHSCIGNADVWDDKPEVEDEFDSEERR
jgi:hypothetical protein